MPIYPPRSLEPYKKRETLAKREEQLRHALSSGGTPGRVQRAAEKVRFAHLAVLKAEAELVRYHPATEERSRHLASIEKKRGFWQDVTVEYIVQQYSTDRV
jgi:hypothetical protein